MTYSRLSFQGTFIALILGLLFSQSVSAQFIFAARRIEGRINQMTQDDSAGKPAYQFATVVIGAPANNVYATAVNIASQNSAVTIISQDAKNMVLKVSEGSSNGTLTVLPLSDRSSEIMISASAAPQGQDPSTTVVINSILKICNQLNKVCKVGAN